MADVDLRGLFAAPPPEFVAARNAMAKVLRADKRREDAAAVTAIRRPGWADWALNAAAHAHGEAVATYVAAAETLRGAQAASIEGRDGPDLKTSLRQLREATATMARHAAAMLKGAGRTPDAGEIAARLSEVAADPATVTQLQAGVLGSSETDGPDLFTGLTPAAAVSKPAAKHPGNQPAKQPRTQTGKKAARATAASTDVDETAAAAERATTRAAEQRARLDAVLAEAEREHASAVGELEEATVMADEASSAVDDAKEALVAAQDARRDAVARRRRAEQAVTRLEKSVAAARHALPA